MNLILLNIYGETPFFNSVELTKRWMQIKGNLLGLDPKLIAEHQELVFKGEENQFNFAISEPTRTGRYFRAWTDLENREVSERKFDALIYLCAKLLNGDEMSFELALKALADLDAEDKKKDSKTGFKWAKYWRKPEGMIKNIESALNKIQFYKTHPLPKDNAASLAAKASRKKNGADAKPFEDTIFTDITKVVISAFARSFRWSKASIMDMVANDVGVPLNANHYNQVQQLVDQLAIAYQKEQIACSEKSSLSG